MSVKTLLTGKVSGERMELVAAGDWTADRADELEQQVIRATPAAKGPVKALRIDMQGRRQARHLWRLAAGAPAARQP